MFLDFIIWIKYQLIDSTKRRLYYFDKACLLSKCHFYEICRSAFDVYSIAIKYVW